MRNKIKGLFGIFKTVLWYTLVIILGTIIIIFMFTVFPLFLFDLLGGGC